MTPDLLGGQLANSQSLTTYAYFTDNSLRLIDPTALDSTHACEEARFCDAIQEGDWGFGPR
jgi:hypothetical protein